MIGRVEGLWWAMNGEYHKMYADSEQLNVWNSGLVHKIDPSFFGARRTYCWTYMDATVTGRKVREPVTCVQCLALILAGIDPWAR